MGPKAHINIPVLFLVLLSTGAQATPPTRPRRPVMMGMNLGAQTAHNINICNRELTNVGDPIALTDPTRVYSWHELEMGAPIQMEEGGRAFRFEGIAPRGIEATPEGPKVTQIMVSLIRSTEGSGRRVLPQLQTLEVRELRLDTVRRLTPDEVTTLARRSSNPPPAPSRESFENGNTVRIEGLIATVERVSFPEVPIRTHEQMAAAVSENFQSAGSWTPREDGRPHIVPFPEGVFHVRSRGLVESATDYQYGVEAGLILEGVFARDLPRDAGYHFVVLENGSWVFGRVLDSWHFGASATALARGRPALAGGQIFIGVDGNYVWNLSSPISAALSNEQIGGRQAEYRMPLRIANLLNRQFAGGEGPARTGQFVGNRPVIVDVDMRQPPSVEEIQRLCRSAVFRLNNEMLCVENRW